MSGPLITNLNLAHFGFDGVTVYVCKETGSIWFPEGTLAAIKHAGPNELNRLDEATTPTAPVQVDSPVPTNCPVDNSLLLKYHYQDCYSVCLEQCLECGGIWISHTELDKLAAIDPNAQAPGVGAHKKGLLQRVVLSAEADKALGEFAQHHERVMTGLGVAHFLAKCARKDVRTYDL